MPPSYFVRRGRLTAQLPCRTRTSYTPELCDSQYTLILRHHLGASHTLAIGSWLIASLDKAMSKPTTSASVLNHASRAHST